MAERNDTQDRHSAWLMHLPDWCKGWAIRLWPTWDRLRSALRGQSGPRCYSCRALTGASDYSICINADLTVSCNCQDFSGLGHIGDLRSGSLAEIFSGPKVAEFLRRLAEGEFPTDVCGTCPELVVLARSDAASAPKQGSLPTRGLMLENTALCNFKCELCRDKRPGLIALRDHPSITLDDLREVSRILRDNHIERLFYFNLGEPFLSPRILEEIQIIREFNPDIWIVMSTNGVVLNTEEKREAALLMDYVYFSIDGVDQESVQRYQIGGDFEKAYQNVKSLVEQRDAHPRTSDGTKLPVIEWKYVMFRWNDEKQQVRRALELAREAGVDVLEFVPGGASAKDRSVRYYTDPTIHELGRPTPDGMAINLGDVREELIAP
jgi:pyruvate-formate lyase-activating enzyme